MRPRSGSFFTSASKSYSTSSRRRSRREYRVSASPASNKSPSPSNFMMGVSLPSDSFNANSARYFPLPEKFHCPSFSVSIVPPTSTHSLLFPGATFTFTAGQFRKCTQYGECCCQLPPPGAPLPAKVNSLSPRFVTFKNTSPACVSIPSSGKYFSFSMRIFTCASSVVSSRQSTLRLAEGSGCLDVMSEIVASPACRLANASCPSHTMFSEAPQLHACSVFNFWLNAQIFKFLRAP